MLQDNEIKEEPKLNLKVPRSLKIGSPTELITAKASQREKSDSKIRTRVNFHFTDNDEDQIKDKVDGSPGSVMQRTSLVKNAINHTPPRQRYLQHF